MKLLLIVAVCLLLSSSCKDLFSHKENPHARIVVSLKHVAIKYDGKTIWLKGFKSSKDRHNLIAEAKLITGNRNVY